KKRERKEPIVLVREAGKSLLPFARVQKIIKADKDIPMVAKDATFLISIATEEFIKRLSEASKSVAEREKRSTVQHKDIATAVRRVDEFIFLEEIIPWLSSESVTKRKPKGTSSGIKGIPTLLDQFVVASKGTEDEDGAEDIIMNEDGTM
ncbi:histone-fold-containing protein, partial [Tricholoma matsutake]